MNSYETVNISDLLEAIGEERLSKRLSDFLCPKNPEIEYFVRNNAIDFAKRNLSDTYFVINTGGAVVGIFTLAHKCAQFKNEGLSNTKRRKLQKFSTYNSNNETYLISAFLIAQFGKNYAVSNAERISGNELMKITLNTLRIIRRGIGGELVFLECEDHPKLLKFYQDNNFTEFNKRYSERDNIKYVQMFSFL